MSIFVLAGYYVFSLQRDQLKIGLSKQSVIRILGIKNKDDLGEAIFKMQSREIGFCIYSNKAENEIKRAGGGNGENKLYLVFINGKLEKWGKGQNKLNEIFKTYPEIAYFLAPGGRSIKD